MRKADLLIPVSRRINLIDRQPQIAFGVQSIDRPVLRNDVVALAKPAEVFEIPAAITTVGTEIRSGHARQGGAR